MIVNAEVFKSPNSNCYIVFGEAKTEDTAAGLGNLGGGGGGGGGFQTESMVSSGKQATGKISATDLDDESGEVDETGVSAKDIETVMTQVNCTRKKAGQPDLDPDSESEQEMSFALFDDESVKLPNPPLSMPLDTERGGLDWPSIHNTLLICFCLSFPFVLWPHSTRASRAGRRFDQCDHSGYLNPHLLFCFLKTRVVAWWRDSKVQRALFVLQRMCDHLHEYRS